MRRNHGILTLKLLTAAGALLMSGGLSDLQANTIPAATYAAQVWLGGSSPNITTTTAGVTVTNAAGSASTSASPYESSMITGGVGGNQYFFSSSTATYFFSYSGPAGNIRF